MNRRQKEIFINRIERRIKRGEKFYVNDELVTTNDIARWRFSLVYDDFVVAAKKTLDKMDDIIAEQSVKNLLGGDNNLQDVMAAQDISDFEKLLKDIINYNGLDEFNVMACDLSHAINDINI